MGHHRPWVHRFTETVCVVDFVWIWYFTLYWEKCIICWKMSDLCVVCLCGSVLHLDGWAVCALGEGVGKRSHTKWPWHINEHGNEAPPPRSGEYHHPWGSAPCAQRAQHLQLHLQLWMRRLSIQPELVFSVSFTLQRWSVSFVCHWETFLPVSCWEALCDQHGPKSRNDTLHLYASVCAWTWTSLGYESPFTNVCKA